MIFSRLGNYRLLSPHFKNASGKFELVLLDDEVFAKAKKDFTLPTNYTGCVRRAAAAKSIRHNSLQRVCMQLSTQITCYSQTHEINYHLSIRS